MVVASAVGAAGSGKDTPVPNSAAPTAVAPPLLPAVNEVIAKAMFSSFSPSSLNRSAVDVSRAVNLEVISVIGSSAE